MENSSDMEDCIPPTPQMQINKVCSRIDKTSVISSKLSRKLMKNDQKNFKRKRIISPCKNAKQKVKQVTLYNFLLKGNTATDFKPESINLDYPTKVNLLSKFEKTESENDDVKLEETEKKNDEADLNDIENRSGNIKFKEYENNNSDAKLKGTDTKQGDFKFEQIKNETYVKFIETEKTNSDLNFELTKNKTDILFEETENKNHDVKFEESENKIGDVKFDETRIMTGEIVSTTVSFLKDINYSESSSSFEVGESDKYICEEVAALEINSSNDHVTFISKDSDNLVCNTVSTKEENSKDFDQTFSWLADCCEKDKMNLEFSCLFENNNIPSDSFIQLDDNYVKFKVKEIKRLSSKNEVILVVSAIKNSNFVKTCHLKGFWADTIVGVGDIVHILKPLKGETTIIDNDSGFLVVNPDFLISSTAVVSTLFCMRKAVLNHILPQWSPGNKVMMIGSLVHDVFQRSVNSHAVTPEEVIKIVKSVMKKKENLIALCFQDLTENEMEENICKYVPNIIEWIKKHCSFKGKNTFSAISITNVEDIEENVWCPKYGVKGKIDMTVNAQCPNEATSKVMPLELKTGRPTFSAEHVGQVNLYSIMMEERSKEVSDGLLLYLRDKVEMKVINSNHNSKRGLIQLRNELASYIYKWVSSKSSPFADIEQCHLPSPINNKRNCEKCPYLLPCTVYQKAFSEEKQLKSTHAMSKLIPLTTSHLTTGHFEYFLHWSRLLLLETTSTAEIKAFWTENADLREKQGMCLSYAVLDESLPAKQEVDGGYFIHTFVRSSCNPVSLDFKYSCLKEGDYVAVSNQENPDEVAVAMGYVILVTEQFIKLAIERNLGTLNHLKGLTFRIDKIVSNSAAASVRNNLMLLMQDDNQAKKLRKLVIDKETPNFLQVLSKQIVLLGRPVLKSLNKIQQKAVLKALMAEDYFLIKGMPGTGKTSTIVALVQLLVKLNISVLLTSYTHSAVDNILLKLKHHVDFVRIGPKYRIHPEILDYSFENMTKDFNSVDQFSSFMKEKMVVATTCLGVNHAIFKLRKFDICIVDEASQINQIACMGPLFYAKKFILVGDDKQLPPLVLNNEARQRGMQESLFQRLQNSSCCIELNMQYRMNNEIMRLCNELTYSGCLQCGSESVANAVLHLDKKLVVDKSVSSWLLSALDTDLSKSVYFLNTDNQKANNTEKNRSDIEADLVTHFLQYLLQYGVAQSDVGIIAPYRKQVDLIEKKLRHLGICNIEVNTVDQYQGRDKDVIIISCIRPSDATPKTDKTGVILDDEKRLNVAISRARKKLILIGSKIGLSEYKPFKNLINCLREDQVLDVI